MPTSSLITALLKQHNADILLGDGTRHTHHTAIIEGSSTPLAALLTSPLTKYEGGRAQITFTELDTESWAVVSHYLVSAALTSHGGVVKSDTSTQTLIAAYDFANAYLLEGLKAIIVKIIMERLSYKELAAFGSLYGDERCLEAAAMKMWAAIQANEKLEPVDSELVYKMLVRYLLGDWKHIVRIVEHVAEHRPQFIDTCVSVLVKHAGALYFAKCITMALSHSDVLNGFSDIKSALIHTYSGDDRDETDDFPHNKEIHDYLERRVR